MGRIAHELINQLTVLNLVGHDILSANGTGPAVKLARDNEIFGRAINDATLLAEQLADYLASQQDKPSAHRSRTIPDQRNVVRILRCVPRADR